MDINASNGPVLINYSDAIITTITIADLGITEAEAIFPEQQLTETLKEHSFDLKGAQISEIGIKEGTVTVNVLSTLPNGKMVYNIPSLKKNGIAFSTEKIVPTTINGERTEYTFDFQDYILDLTGKEGRIGGDTVNTIYSELITYIDSTGELVTLNQQDSFYYETEFIFTPKYAMGYLGMDTLNIGPEIIENNIFDNIIGGEINLNNTNLSIEIENYFGADANLKFTDFSAENSNTGNTSTPTFDQNGNNFLGHVYNINRASLLNPSTPEIQPSNTSIILNADEMLGILPDKITTSLDIFLNPNGQSTVQDFIYTDYPIDAAIQLKIPLNLIANNLNLRDTTELDINQNEEINIEKIYLKVENGFPINCDIQMILLDENKNIIDTVFNNQTITSGFIQNNIVIEKSINTLETNGVIFDDARHIIFDARFNTDDINTFISIYNDYTIDFLLSAKISTSIN